MSRNSIILIVSIVFPGLLAVPAAPAQSRDVPGKRELDGSIQIVESPPDWKVRIVDAFPDYKNI